MHIGAGICTRCLLSRYQKRQGGEAKALQMQHYLGDVSHILLVFTGCAPEADWNDRNPAARGYAG